MRSLFTLLAICTAFPAMAAPSILLSNQSTIRSAVIRLGDIASIQGLTASDTRRAASIALGRAPSVGVAKFVPKSFIEARIRRRLGKSVRVQGPHRLEITRRSSMIRGEDLKRMVRTAVQAKMPHRMEQVAGIRIPRLADIRVPEGARARVEFKSNEAFHGTVDTKIIIEDGPLSVSSRRVNVNIDLFTMVLTTREELRRGHVISPGDLVPLQAAESAVPGDAVRRPEFVMGAEVRRRIRPGQPIRQAWFKIPPVVKRGQRVRVVAVRGRIRISTMGEALNNAGKGAFVRVRNLDSRKIVTGKATEAGTVEMEF